MTETFHIVELAPGSYYLQDYRALHRPVSVGTPLLASRVHPGSYLWAYPVDFFGGAFPKARVVKVTATAEIEADTEPSMKDGSVDAPS